MSKPKAERGPQLCVRVSEEELKVLTVLAQSAGYASAAGFLRYLGQRAIRAEAIPPSTGPACPATPPDGRIEELQQRLAELSEQVGRIEKLIQAGLAHLSFLEGLVRSTALQATSASYMAIQVWRLLADETLRPPSGIPSQMLSDIQELHRRALAAAESHGATTG
ncbi:conserved protein of unknown function (plasmid) [Rhodovastum atsumiense]|uniref:Uncharacterized protein n=1 Tax=Rhodovastum atsumiense TaxID=504468 RepID=A0A5M6IK73_9PROT|nr:hypothetical protein [Rhodovastum atsumiense]KAA5608640.1 hypothetical protein F1189_28175 [Rhodovastum atsumiense]CAH2605965.1 conserved protein of unknown function [Rhodovastum atsumiense]